VDVSCVSLTVAGSYHWILLCVMNFVTHVAHLLSPFRHRSRFKQTNIIYGVDLIENTRDDGLIKVQQSLPNPKSSSVLMLCPSSSKKAPSVMLPSSFRLNRENDQNPRVCG